MHNLPACKAKTLNIAVQRPRARGPVERCGEYMVSTGHCEIERTDEMVASECYLCATKGQLVLFSYASPCDDVRQSI